MLKQIVNYMGHTEGAVMMYNNNNDNNNEYVLNILIGCCSCLVYLSKH